MKDNVRNYYKINYEKKVFCDKKNSKEKNYFILYLNDFKYEVDNFKETFVSFLPAYVKPDEFFNVIFKTDNIQESLNKESKKIWNSSAVLQHRQTKIDGLYGELFLDFYSRVVNHEKFFITYTSKRAYGSNYENLGYDQLYYSIDENGDICLVIAESKFVTTKSSCHSELLKDINGAEDKPSHLTKDYFNNYMGYVLDKNSFEEFENPNTKKEIGLFVEKLNECAINDNSLLDYLIENQIRIKLVLFGIFKEEDEDIQNYNDIYENLEKDAIQKFIDMGVSNFNIEIVFIPTKNKSMDIKGGISSYYDEK